MSSTHSDTTTTACVDAGEGQSVIVYHVYRFEPDTSIVIEGFGALEIHLAAAAVVAVVVVVAVAAAVAAAVVVVVVTNSALTKLTCLWLET